VLRGEHHVCCPEQSVRSCRINPHRIRTGLFGEARICARFRPFGKIRLFADVKINFRALASSYPVFLHFLDRIRPLETLEVLYQTIGIVGDSQHPLSQWNALHGMIAPFRAPVDDFFIGKHRSKRSAPVHRGFGLIREAEGILVQPNGVLSFAADGIRYGEH